MEVFCVNNLTKNKNGVNIINNLSFTIKEGEIISLFDQDFFLSSTLIKIIAGKEFPTSGMIELQGKDLFNKSNLTNLGIMSDNYDLYERLTVKEYLNFFRRLYNIENKRLQEVLSLVGLQDRKDIKIKHLSNSFKKRVQFARTILHKPTVLVLEKSLLGLDFESKQIFRNIIIELAQKGIAILLMTISFEEARLLSDRIAKVEKGQITSWEKVGGEEPDKIKTSEKIISFNKIPAQVEGKIIFFNPQELLYIESNDGNALLHTENNQFFCPLILNDLEKRLQTFGFFRSHRSYIVNLQRLREVIPWSRNSYSIILDDNKKTEIPLSKSNYKQLEDILGF
ncbi:MAG: LytTR family transcriptional regulator DNA-binding domain-containing protein [Halanaerobiales bacterium]